MRSPTVTIVGLGPGGAGRITDQTRAAIADHDDSVSFVRTRRHPTADLLAGGRSFDELYDEGASLPEVYAAIAETVAATALEAGRALYAVPGSPLVLERAVALLRDRTDIQVNLLPAISFLDEVWARLAVDPVESAVRLIDGHTFSAQAAGATGPLLVAHAHAPWVLSDIKLAIDAGPEQRVIVLQRLGMADEAVFEVAWPDLDREVEPDHLTSLYLPEVAAPVAGELQGTVELMARLRSECPWDEAQTHASLRRYLLEETYEVLEAIDEVVAGAPDGYHHLEEELGDLWFQILFHSQLASESGAFTVADVARTANDKLVGRHPHVFGEVEASDAAAVARNWEAIKAEEKGRSSVMDGIPVALPALALAEKIVTKGRRRAGALAREDLELLDQLLGRIDPEAETDETVGRRLLAVVTVAQLAGVDAEAALRFAAHAARDRFVAAEATGDVADRWILG